MLTQNETIAKLTEESSKENSPVDSPKPPADSSKSNDISFSEKPSVVMTGTIFIPLFAALASVAVAVVGGIFTWGQFAITYDREIADSTNQAKETKEQVLTDYSKTMADLFMKKEGDGTIKLDEREKNIARGHTLIALRRLNTDKDQENGNNQSEDETQDYVSDKSQETGDENFQEKDADQSKNDAGELKGLLIRYLHENKVIGYLPETSEEEEIGRKVPMIFLGGADLENAVFKDAWLPYAGLSGAELSDAEFTKADLRHADLKGADLSRVNLSSADLRFADLRFANLSSAKNLSSANLKGACYVEGLEDDHFPPDFEPEKRGMLAIPDKLSRPNNEFQKCSES